MSLSVSSQALARPTSGEPAPRQKPNILVILLDDMGYSDIGCFGGEIPTPHIDRLAAEGVRFTHFYNTARCCPSRASILTGMYAHQVGVGYMDSDWGHPAYRGRLNADCVTIAESLRAHGYRTVMSGKWHLGTGKDDNPWERGFERFYGIPAGGGVYFWPSILNRDVVLYDKANGKGPVVTEPDETFYSTDAFTDYAVQQIRRAHEDQMPFFLYLAYVAPHYPQQAWEKDIRKYLGKYRAGWETLRRERYRRQIEMGIIEPRHKLSPCDGLDWDKLTDEQETRLDRQMAVYAAQMDNLDHNVGKITGALKQLGIDRDTLVLFLSDNGGQKNPAMGFERIKGAVFGTRQSFGGYAKGWANLSNTPFRRYKSEEHEGGNATPLIARWPGVIRDRGQIRRQVGHIIDIVPTCLDAAGLDGAVAQRGEVEQRLEGISLLPFFRDQLPAKSRTLFWEHHGHRAVRVGDWKLVALHRRKWELYHMREDRTELHDLAKKHPDRVAELRKLYQSWATRCNVLPWPVKKRK